MKTITKTCKIHGLTEFYKCGKCKKCALEYSENNKDKIKKYQKKYREMNNDKLKEYREKNRDKMNEYYEKNRDKMNEYRKKNRDKIKECNKKYYEKNKDSINKNMKLYREKNKDNIKECAKEYYEKNKGKLDKYSKEYRNNLTSLFNKNGFLNVIIEFNLYNRYHKQLRNRVALDFTFDEYYRFHKTKNMGLKLSLALPYGKGIITKEDVLFQCGEVLTERDKQMLSIFKEYYINENDRHLKIEKFINKLKEAGLFSE